MQSIDLVFNGYSMLQSQEKIDCLIAGSNGKSVEMQITFADYEIMCKQAIDEDFCQCDTRGIDMASQDQTTISSTIDEIYEANNITKEV